MLSKINHGSIIYGIQVNKIIGVCMDNLQIGGGGMKGSRGLIDRDSSFIHLQGSIGPMWLQTYGDYGMALYNIDNVMGRGIVQTIKGPSINKYGRNLTCYLDPLPPFCM